jgi:hypothetical protein
MRKSKTTRNILDALACAVELLFFTALVAIICLGRAPSQAEEVKAPKEYTRHYYEAKKDKSAFMILMNMDNCPGCIIVHNDPKYGEATLRKTAHFMTLKWEDYPDLCKQVVGAKEGDQLMFPMLVVNGYNAEEKAWRSFYYVGADKIREYVRTKVVPSLEAAKRKKQAEQGRTETI